MPAAKRKSRSGSNIPEDLRGSMRVRVPRELVEELARRLGTKPADAVVRVVEEALANPALSLQTKRKRLHKALKEAGIQDPDATEER